MSEMLELRHISKTFGAGTINEKKAVEDLSLTLASGDFVTIIGGNGAGQIHAVQRCCGRVLCRRGPRYPGRRGYDVPAGI